jgi:hypothetical protein
MKSTEYYKSNIEAIDELAHNVLSLRNRHQTNPESDHYIQTPWMRLAFDGDALFIDNNNKAKCNTYTINLKFDDLNDPCQSQFYKDMIRLNSTIESTIKSGSYRTVFTKGWPPKERQFYSIVKQNERYDPYINVNKLWSRNGILDKNVMFIDEKGEHLEFSDVEPYLVRGTLVRCIFTLEEDFKMISKAGPKIAIGPKTALKQLQIRRIKQIEQVEECLLDSDSEGW